MEDIYIYSLWGGRLKVYKGYVDTNYKGDGTGLFISKHKKIVCSAKPLEVYNGVVWSKNKDEAIIALIEYQNKKISELMNKAYDHSYNNDLLWEAFMEDKKDKAIIAIIEFQNKKISELMNKAYNHSHNNELLWEAFMEDKKDE